MFSFLFGGTTQANPAEESEEQNNQPDTTNPTHPKTFNQLIADLKYDLDIPKLLCDSLSYLPMDKPVMIDHVRDHAVDLVTYKKLNNNPFSRAPIIFISDDPVTLQENLDKLQKDPDLARLKNEIQELTEQKLAYELKKELFRDGLSNETFSKEKKAMLTLFYNDVSTELKRIHEELASRDKQVKPIDESIIMMDIQINLWKQRDEFMQRLEKIAQLRTAIQLNYTNTPKNVGLVNSARLPGQYKQYLQTYYHQQKKQLAKRCRLLTELASEIDLFIKLNESIIDAETISAEDTLEYDSFRPLIEKKNALAHELEMYIKLTHDFSMDGERNSKAPKAKVELKKNLQLKINVITQELANFFQLGQDVFATEEELLAKKQRNAFLLNQKSAQEKADEKLEILAKPSAFLDNLSFQEYAKQLNATISTEKAALDIIELQQLTYLNYGEKLSDLYDGIIHLGQQIDANAADGKRTAALTLCGTHGLLLVKDTLVAQLTAALKITHERLTHLQQLQQKLLTYAITQQEFPQLASSDPAYLSLDNLLPLTLNDLQTMTEKNAAAILQTKQLQSELLELEQAWQSTLQTFTAFFQHSSPCVENHFELTEFCLADIQILFTQYLGRLSSSSETETDNLFNTLKERFLLTQNTLYLRKAELTLRLAKSNARISLLAQEIQQEPEKSLQMLRATLAETDINTKQTDIIIKEQQPGIDDARIQQQFTYVFELESYIKIATDWLALNVMPLTITNEQVQTELAMKSALLSQLYSELQANLETKKTTTKSGSDNHHPLAFPTIFSFNRKKMSGKQHRLNTKKLSHLFAPVFSGEDEVLVSRRNSKP